MTRALIIGGGVSGLTTAACLIDAGFQVRLVTRELFPQTTSSVAAAVWYPYRAYPFERVLGWAGRSLQRFEALAADPQTGITLLELHEYLAIPAPDPWWKPAVPGFRRLTSQELVGEFRDGFSIRVPMIESSLYLSWLSVLIERSGARIETREIRSFDECDSDLVVNCSGLGSRELCGDKEVFPVRGQILKTPRSGVQLARVVHGQGPRGVTYVIPRSGDCVLGTTADDHDWSVEPDPATTRDILQRATELEPRLRGAAVLETRAGLRPGRREVRLEREGRVIHNYGHGGSGFTLSWGCAEEVVTLALQSAG